MKEFLIASNNPKKIEELERILNPLGIKAISAKEAGINLGDIEETGTTFKENAYIKAKAAYKLTGKPCVADDSGLLVDALGGRPGVYSARYSGENATDKDNVQLLLKEMENVKDKDRTAAFASCVCVVINETDVLYAFGKCEGYIGHSPKGSNGFGYDPIFLLENGTSFAELSSQEKDKISHRGKALYKLQNKLEKYYTSEET